MIKKLFSGCFVIIVFIVLLQGCMPKPVDNKKNYENGANEFNKISEIIFGMYDDGVIDYTTILNLSDIEQFSGSEEALNDESLYNLLITIRKNYEINTVYIVDSNVILYSAGGFFQSVSGIVKTRNNPELVRDWHIGTDGAITYEQIAENTYIFSDGL